MIYNKICNYYKWIKKLRLKMVLYDDTFHHYAFTRLGSQQFINLFHTIIDRRTLLFGYNHNIYDNPAYIWKDGFNKEWKYRDNRRSFKRRNICTFLWFLNLLFNVL